MEENTSKYPDIISMLPQTLKPGITSCVMDSEIIAYDRVEKKLMPFQSLSTRSKKDTKEEDIKIQVIMTAFDLLYLNGESLLQKPLGERRKLLLENFQEVEGKFTFAIGKDAKNMSEIEEFLDESIKGNCEGLMVKTLYKDATYEPSKRSLNWLKSRKITWREWATLWISFLLVHGEGRERANSPLQTFGLQRPGGRSNPSPRHLA